MKQLLKKYGKDGSIFGAIALLFGLNIFASEQVPIEDVRNESITIVDSTMLNPTSKARHYYRVTVLMKAQRSAFVDLFPVRFGLGTKPDIQTLDKVFRLVKFKKGPYVYGEDMEILEITEFEQIR